MSELSIRYIEDFLKSKGHTFMPLNILKEDEQLANVMIFQPKGEVQGDKDGIRVNSQGFEQKVTTFFSLANNVKPDLVISPEYCIPWSFATEKSSFIRPEEGALWALGFQSIKREELMQIISNNDVVEWFAEVPEQSEKVFLNPLVYFFYSKKENNIKLTGVVQFKTKPMVDTVMQLERTNLITGSEIFVFRNEENSIHLASIICSDALDFDPRSIFPQWKHLPHILLHPQLNTVPNYNIFRQYRVSWAQKSGEKKQIFAVNWARETRINNSGTSEQFGLSAFYTKDQPIVGNNDHQSNHDKGLYYSFSKDRVHGFYFNFDEHIYVMKVSKVGRGDVDAASANFSCPKNSKAFAWNETDLKWVEVDTLDDGYIANCSWTCGNFPSLSGQTIHQIEKELIMNWATGAIGGDLKTLQSVESIVVDEGEHLRRLTFTHDKSNEATSYRSSKNTLFNDLCSTILTQVQSFPANIAHFASNNQLKKSIKKKFNLTSGASEAFICYIGEASDEEALRIFNRICGELHESERRRICVWHKRHGVLNYKVETSTDINVTFTSMPADITREI